MREIKFRAWDNVKEKMIVPRSMIWAEDGRLLNFGGVVMNEYQRGWNLTPWRKKK